MKILKLLILFTILFCTACVHHIAETRGIPRDELAIVDLRNFSGEKLFRLNLISTEINSMQVKNKRYYARPGIVEVKHIDGIFLPPVYQGIFEVEKGKTYVVFPHIEGIGSLEQAMIKVICNGRRIELITVERLERLVFPDEYEHYLYYHDPSISGVFILEEEVDFNLKNTFGYDIFSNSEKGP